MYNIIEVANTHGGNFEYLSSLIDEFSEFDTGFGIKFQAFKYDQIATKDFEWYPVYEKLFFNKTQWETVINKAVQTKDVWLDIFDLYGVDILKKNIVSITGIKLQASVLYNYTVLEALSRIDLTDLKLIINIASFEIDEIRSIIKRIEQQLNIGELLIELGFQAYPTELSDAGISKIKILRNSFSNRLVFADHADGKSLHATMLPILASVLKVDVIEKHVMHSSLPTEYDFYSSIKVAKYREFISYQKEYLTLNEAKFVTPKEIEYLEKSIQTPLLKKDRQKGDKLNLADFDYKRSDKNGLNAKEIDELIAQNVVFVSNVKAGNGINKDMLK